MPTFEDDAEESYGWTARDMEIAEDIFRRILETDGRKPAERGRRNPFPFCTSLAKNGGSTIAARSGTTVGSGTVTLYKCDDTTLVALTGDYSTVTAYNMSGSTVAANAYLQIKRIGNKWFVDVEDCG